MRRLIVALILSTTLGLLLSNWGAGATAPIYTPMKLDPGWGGNGRVLVDIAGDYHEDEPFMAVQQPDGKILTPGKAYRGTTTDYDFVVLRYNLDGTLDTTFNGTGEAFMDFQGGHDEGLALALQPDGKIVESGIADNPAQGGVGDFGLARFNSDGTPDVTFGDQGKVMTDFTGRADQSLAVAIQPDGKIVAAGYATGSTTQFDFGIARYNPNGTLDTTFGWAGRVMLDIDKGVNGVTKGLIIQPDGKIVVSGMAYMKATGNYDFALARFNTNGALDTTFATYGRAGVVTTDFFGGADTGFNLSLTPDGKLLETGLAYNPRTGNYDMALARYTANGSLDATFGTNGKTALDFFGNYDQGLSIAYQPDGKIVIAGHAYRPGQHFDFALARFSPDGIVDPSFGYGGRFTVNFYNGPDGLHALVITEDGRLLAFGDAQNPNTGGDDFASVGVLGADPSWVRGVVSKLPSSTFALGGQSSVISQLNAVESDLNGGSITNALADLRTLRGHIDGCGDSADGDDWVTDCISQLKVRVLVDQIIAKLGG